MSSSENSVADEKLSHRISDGMMKLQSMYSSYLSCCNMCKLLEMYCVLVGEHISSNRKEMSSSENSVADEKLSLSISDGMLKLESKYSSSLNCCNMCELLEMYCVLVGEHISNSSDGGRICHLKSDALHETQVFSLFVAKMKEVAGGDPGYTQFDTFKLPCVWAKICSQLSSAEIIRNTLVFRSLKCFLEGGAGFQVLNKYDQEILVLTSKTLDHLGQSNISLLRNPEGILLVPLIQHLVLEEMPNGAVVGSCFGVVLLLDISIRSFFLYNSFSELDSRLISFPTDQCFLRYAVGIGFSTVLGDFRVLLFLYAGETEHICFVYSVKERCWKPAGHCPPADISGQPGIYHSDSLYFVNLVDYGIVRYDLNHDVCWLAGCTRNRSDLISSRRIGVLGDELVVVDVLPDQIVDVFRYRKYGTENMYRVQLVGVSSLMPVAYLCSSRVVFVVDNSYLGMIDSCLVDEAVLTEIVPVHASDLATPLYACLHYGGFFRLVDQYRVPSAGRWYFGPRY